MTTTPRLKDPVYELFAIALARGIPPTRAYQYAFPDEPPPDELTLKHLCEEVCERVPELQQANDRDGGRGYAGEKDLGEQLEFEAPLTEKEVQSFLARVVRTPAGKVDEYSSLAQRVERTSDGRVKIWMPDKRLCIALAAKLQSQAEKRKQSTTTTTASTAAPASSSNSTSKSPAPLQRDGVFTREMHMQLIEDVHAATLEAEASRTSPPNQQQPSSTQTDPN